MRDTLSSRHAPQHITQGSSVLTKIRPSGAGTPGRAAAANATISA